jgi:hypothetical protein
MARFYTVYAPLLMPLPPPLPSCCSTHTRWTPTRQQQTSASMPPGVLHGAPNSVCWRSV